jgi:ZipA, C-terminal FtsZ-binding domain
MSELQIGLLAIGIAVVAGVFGYNKWQEAKLRRKTEAAFPGRTADVLLGDQAKAAGTPAPRGDTASDADADTAPLDQPERVEHMIGPATGPTVDPVVKVGRSPVLMDGVDYVVEIECVEPVRGDAVRAAAIGHFGGSRRAVNWEGFSIDTDAWEQGSDAGRYELLRVGLQLASRAGPAGESEVASFAAAAQAFAASIGGVADYPDVREGAAAAAALDRFCADVDVQIGFNIVRADGGTFPGTKIRTLAEAAGCTLDPDGRYRRRDDSGAELYALGDSTNVPFRSDAMREAAASGLTVTLDVPRAPDGAASYRRFLDFARQVEQTLGGTLVDDNRRPLVEPAFQQIAAQLDAVQKSMAAHGIRAGSPVALRVFA